MMILLAARKYYDHDDVSKMLRKYFAGPATSLGYCKFQMAASRRSLAGNVKSYALGLPVGIGGGHKSEESVFWRWKCM